VSAGLSGLSAILGPEIHGGHLEASRGVGAKTELALRWTHVRLQEESSAGTDPTATAVRLGVKHNPGGNQNVAVIGGVGGGGTAAGRFYSTDLGLALSIENCHLVPTVAARGIASVPIDPRRVDTSSGGDPPGTDLDTPKRTWGYDLGFGLELPIGGCGGRAPVAVRANVGSLSLYDGETDEHMMQGTIGAVARF